MCRPAGTSYRVVCGTVSVRTPCCKCQEIIDPGDRVIYGYDTSPARGRTRKARFRGIVRHFYHPACQPDRFLRLVASGLLTEEN